MEYFVAVASTDGRLIDQHFGKAGAFRILKVEDDERFAQVECRSVTPSCSGCGNHDVAGTEAVVKALADCRYVLRARIGRSSQAALQAAGITPLEIMHMVVYAMEKVMLYDRRTKQEKRNKTYGRQDA